VNRNRYRSRYRGSAASGGSPPFTPASIPNLLAWYDAADAGTIIQTAGSVSQWNDKSGNAYNVTQGTGASQPTTGTRTQNSLNVLDFTSDGIQVPDAFRDAVTNSNSTLLIVFNSDVGGQKQTLLTGLQGGGAVNFGSLITSGNNVIYSHGGFEGGPAKAYTFGNPAISIGSRAGTLLSEWLNGGVAATTNGGGNDKRRRARRNGFCGSAVYKFRAVRVDCYNAGALVFNREVKTLTTRSC